MSFYYPPKYEKAVTFLIFKHVEHRRFTAHMLVEMLSVELKYEHCTADR